jgi:hypothetical protein
MKTDPDSHPVSLSAFSGALVDPDKCPPEGIIGPDGKKAVKRFNVYRNNVTVGLINALSDTFPAVQHLVGETFFNAMARIYVQLEPPTSPLLFLYGKGFPAFLEQFEPAQKLAYLPDIARLERAWLDAYHAADCVTLSADDLGRVDPADLPAQVFRAHPAARIMRSRYAAVSIFSANRSGQQVSGLDPNVPEDGLITRRGNEVEIRQLPPGAAIFLGALIDGQPLGVAAGAAVREFEQFDLAAAIAAMLEAGVFTGLTNQE